MATMSSKLMGMKFMQRRADPSTIVTPEVPVTLDESFWMLDADLGEAAKSAVEYEPSEFLIVGGYAPTRRSFTAPAKSTVQEPVFSIEDDAEVKAEDMAEQFGMRGQSKHSKRKHEKEGKKKNGGGSRPRLR